MINLFLIVSAIIGAILILIILFQKTARAIPSVMFGSVVGTTLKYASPGSSTNPVKAAMFPAKVGR